MSQTIQSPPDLSTLQDWEREDWEQYDPCLWRGEPSTKRVMKTIIRAADRELYWRGRESANSLREFWYNPVKPIVQRTFPGKEADPEFSFSREMSKRLSGALSELVKDGEITYRSLNILDESREREIHHGTPDADKLLFVEKDAAYRKLRPLERVYELSVVSGGGWQSTALIEDLARELPSGETYTVYLLTDYDPTGWQIGEDFRDRAEGLGVSIGEVRRLGILPDQLDAKTRRRQRYTPEVKNEFGREWMDTHAINGKYGLEIEAIGDLNQKGKALREIVVDELRDEINVREHRKRATDAAMSGAARKAVSGVAKEITGDLERAVAEAVVDELNGLPGVTETSLYGLNVEASAALVLADDGREWLPDPYDPEELHTGAVQGTRPTVSKREAAQYLAERVREHIQSDEFDFTEYLDVGGGEAGA